ncbi:hypothetical protein HQ544_01155 [Candidatus Falkowbacteria bacterium]|nr:hypothetical protein [Candidatus Falkowbacteria bacterium]
MSKLVMLDTNILFKFILIQEKVDIKESIPKDLKSCHQLMDKFYNRDFLNCTSDWNLLELRDVVYKYKLEKQLLLSGYHPTEFRNAQKNIKLKKEDMKSIEELINHFRTYSIRYTAPINTNYIDSLSVNNISMKDAMLLYEAQETPHCEAFITKDNILINKIKKLPFEFALPVYSIKGFLNAIPHPSNG